MRPIRDRLLAFGLQGLVATAAACSNAIRVGDAPSDGPSDGDGPASTQDAGADGVLSTDAAGAAGQGSWSLVYPQPTSATLRGAFGVDGKVIVVGDMGTILSFDGMAFSSMYQGEADDAFYAVW